MIKLLIYKAFVKLFKHAFFYRDSELRNLLINEIKNQRFNFASEYDGYRKQYQLDETFRFNGIFILFYGEGIIITGKGSYIGDYSSIYANKETKVVIGNNVRISHNVRIYTESVVADQDFSKKNLKCKSGDVIIEDDVWIGANVFINPGVKIGRNSVVGANSVVTSSIPSDSIFGGVPAKLIRNKTTTA